jgi:hypothetical protein
MPTLTDLQKTAQEGSTLGGIASNTGVTPSNAQTASSLGASPNAAQMAGTPQQQAAAIKESTSSKSTLSYLQRTETGRAKELEGQSKEALEKVAAAKELAGLGGKVGAATANAVAAANTLPLSVTANIETYETTDPTLKASLPADLKVLQETLVGTDGKAQMEAWKKIKTKYNLTTDAIAKMFNVDPDALWGQLEKSITGTNVKMRDMVGVADDSQIEAARKLMGAEDLDTFEDMNWQDAKALINQTLNNATANVTDLQKQASDPTLPASTRSMAVQRLRELGVSGEYQAAGAIQQEQGKLEASDNMIIGDKSYEVQDVLKSPEAKEAIINVLNGTADLKSLEGGPLAGLIPLIKNNADELAAKFGIGEDGRIGVGKLQQIEQTRTTNEKSISDWLTNVGIPVPAGTDKEALKSLGITDDVINGYSSFDSNSLAGNKVIDMIKNIPAGPERAAQQAAIWATLGHPGMSVLLDGTHPSLVNLLGTKSGQVTLQNLSKASTFLGVDAYKDDQNAATELQTMFKDIGLTGLLDQPGMIKLEDTNLRDLGVEIPAGLDTNNDGILQPKEIQSKLMSAGTLEERNAILESLKSVNLNKARETQKADDSIRSVKGLDKPLTTDTLKLLIPGASATMLSTVLSQWVRVDPFKGTGQLEGRPGDGTIRPPEYYMNLYRTKSAADSTAIANATENNANLLATFIKQLEDKAKQAGGSPKLQAELNARVNVFRNALVAARKEAAYARKAVADIHGTPEAIAKAKQTAAPTKVVPNREWKNQ